MAPMAFTFGSFGDIVTLIQLCCALVSTVQDQSNPAEYLQLMVELKSLLELLKFVQWATTSPQSSSVPPLCTDALQNHIQNCHKLITQFIERTQPNRSRICWEFWWNVEWSLLRKNAAVELKMGLAEQKTGMIFTLMTSNL
jgi:hypothetical protein